jgi:hypothetical protein
MEWHVVGMTLRSTCKQCHRNRVKYLLYIGLGIVHMHIYAPGGAEKHDEMPLLGQPVPGVPNSLNTKQEFHCTI